MRVAEPATGLAFPREPLARLGRLGHLDFGHGGIGSAGHLGGEILKQRGGFFAVHIPYAGGAPSQLALVSGQVDYTLIKTPAGWRVYNVSIEGASLVTIYRNNFNDILRQGGPDALIQSLKDKNDALSGGKHASN